MYICVYVHDLCDICEYVCVWTGFGGGAMHASQGSGYLSNMLECECFRILFVNGHTRDDCELTLPAVRCRLNVYDLIAINVPNHSFTVDFFLEVLRFSSIITS
jgi:hypothetical protein